MSDIINPDPANPTPPPNPVKGKKPRKPKKPGRWRRRFVWTFSILVLLGVALRTVLPYSLPIVLKKVAGIYGLNCTYDSMELNLFSGDAGIWGFKLIPKEGGEPILTAEYCHGNLSVLQLFHGRLDVWRLEADGVDLNVDRQKDGHIPLLDRIVAIAGNGTPPPVSLAPATKPSTAKPGEIDLSSPLRVDALRLGHIRVHIHDRGITPELDTELAMDLRLSDLGSPDRPANFEMNLSADPLLDTLRVSGEGRSGGMTLDASIHVLVRGIHVKPAAAYLAPLGIVPVSDSITLRADGKVHTDAAAGNAGGFSGYIDFDHLSALADWKEAAALDHLRIDADAIDTKSIHIAKIALDGARATGGRNDKGNFEAAGIAYDPALAKKSVESDPSKPSPLIETLKAMHITLGELALHNGRLDLRDQAVSPAVDLAFVADELSAKSIDYDPQNANTSVALSGTIHAPGLIRDIRLAGSVQPFAEKKTIHGELTATGIRPDAIRSYLEPLGIESTLKDARFSATLDASVLLGDTVTANAKITQVELRDDKPLLAMNQISVTDAKLTPKTTAVDVADIEISGPGVSILRTGDGQLAALGLKTKPRDTRGTGVLPVSASSTQHGRDARVTFSLDSLPRVTVGKFGWKDIRLNLEDQTTSPPSTITFSDVGVQAKDLSTDPATKKAGHFKAWFASPEVGQIAAEGDVTPSTDGVKAQMSVNGSGLNAMPLAAYIKPLGVEPTLRNGSLSLTAQANLAFKGPTASLSLADLKYTDGDTDLAHIGGLTVEDISLTDGVLKVDQIKVVSPGISVARDAGGGFLAAGLRLPPPAQPDPNVKKTSSTMPSIPTLPLVVSLPKIEVSNASLAWHDQGCTPAVRVVGNTSFHLDGLIVGKAAAPARLDLAADLSGSLRQAHVTGEINTDLDHPSAHLEISADGLTTGSLAAYLPPGIECSLKDAKFSTVIDAAISKNSDGGIGATFTTGALDFSDGDPLFHLDRVKVNVPRIDLEHAIAVQEISVAGVATHAQRTADGKLACMGFMVVKADSPEPKKLAAEAASPVVVVSSTATGPSVKDILASAHRVLPSVTVETLDIGASSITFTDRARPDAKPVIISDLRLHNLNRIDWLGPNAAGKPPTHLQFECKVSPLVDRVLVDAMVTPFAPVRSVVVDFSATGVHGQGLTDLVPELKPQISGTTMENGSISAHLEAEAKLEGRDPLDFDVSHGLDLSFVLSKVAWRASPDGPVLAGVEEVRSEGIRVQPAESIVHIKTLEITNPVGLVTQDAAGIHALGWIIPVPGSTAATQPTVSAAPSPQVPATTQPVAPTGEVRVDKLLISGLDFRVEDTAVDPPLIVPLNGLDVEVRNFSSLAPYVDRPPIRFSAIVNAGKVKLPKKGSNPPVMEERDLFSQITANGELTIIPNHEDPDHPRFRGWAKSSVSGFDLAALEGPAKMFHEALTGGLYDDTADLTFDPSGALAVQSRFIFTDLSLSEPPNGLIQTFLKIPAPLDVAIGITQNADGSLVFPVNLSVDPNNISVPGLVPPALGAVSSVIITAITAAPLKAVNDVGGIFGLASSKPTQDLSMVMNFAAGSAAMGPTQSAALAPLLQHLHDDPTLTVTLKAQLGGGDVRLSAVRANPTPEQCGSVEVSLRSRKAALLALRADAAGKARAQLVSTGPAGADGALQQLRAIDRELAATEESLDQMGELLKPGAYRLTGRRTRAAALQLSSDRSIEIEKALLAAGIARDRIKKTTPQFTPEETLDGGRVALAVVAVKK